MHEAKGLQSEIYIVNNISETVLNFVHRGNSL